MLEPRQLNVETYLEFMNLAETRRAVHVGDQEFQSPNKVYFSMQGDFMQSSMPIVEGLLEKGLRIMFYRYLKILIENLHLFKQIISYLVATWTLFVPIPCQKMLFVICGGVALMNIVAQKGMDSIWKRNLLDMSENPKILRMQQF